MDGLDKSGLAWPLSLVFGGCCRSLRPVVTSVRPLLTPFCSNAWTLEQLLTLDARLATSLTLIQMLFTATHSLPAVMNANGSFKPRVVPLQSWAVQVVVFTAMSLLNGWVFLYPVPITVQIIFRSAALLVSMSFNFLFNGKRYNTLQVVSRIVVSRCAGD